MKMERISGIILRRKEIAAFVNGLPVLQKRSVIAEVVSAAFHVAGAFLHYHPVSLLAGRELLAINTPGMRIPGVFGM